MRFLILFALYVMLDARFSLYNIADPQTSYATFDCLYAYLNDDTKELNEAFIRNYHLIPYCRRPANNETQKEIDSFSSERGRQIRFSDLNKEGVTSADLLAWMAPIEVAERYGKYSENSQDVFYNCTPPWFGSTCQYMFDYNTPSLFGDIVDATFSKRTTGDKVMKSGSTCYPFLNTCYRGPSRICLDWREICNGRFDCVNGEDEQMCGQLELNECATDEYRCHLGGQCIPLIFAREGSRNADCLDGSDERDTRRENVIGWMPNIFSFDCDAIPTFLCEESTCRNIHSFSCGNGQCTPFHEILSSATSCANCRGQQITQSLLTSDDDISDIACQQTLLCLIRIAEDLALSCSLSPFDYLSSSLCEPLASHCSSEWIGIPAQPILFGFFQFVYLTNRSVAEFENNVLPNFVCFHPQRCPGLLQTIVHIELNNNLICCHVSDIVTQSEMLYFDQIHGILFDAIERCLTIGTELECSHPSLFHCAKSLKCISRHRLVDGHKDCYFNEDELYSACRLNDSNRYECESNATICLLPIAVGDNFPNCPLGEEDLDPNFRSILKRPPFSDVCLQSMQIQSELMRQRECQWWPCNNPYTRCDGNWHCHNGIDELNCPDSRCLSNEYLCQLPSPLSSLCLSIEHLYETYSDDCGPNTTYIDRKVYFNNRTNSNMSQYISWNKTRCITEDKVCRRQPLASNFEEELCALEEKKMSIDNNVTVLTDKETSVCYSINQNWNWGSNSISWKALKNFLGTYNLGYFPSISASHLNEIISTANETLISSPKINISLDWHCNRGILVRQGYNRTKVCLCPPSYFGDRCQWQNQRISLTLRFLFRSATSNNVVFHAVIMLIDDESGQILPSHEHIIYVPARDCNTKFNIYLLYPDRPKRASGNYSIRIDVFNKTTLKYYASWYLPIPFPFLPVNRLAAGLFMPDTHEAGLCSMSCGKYGKCREYINKKSAYFCQCDEGYSGSSCNIPHVCHCSNDSQCLSSSICVCPLNKFGFQCHLEQFICQPPNNPCKNNGLCIPADGRIGSSKFTCLCPGYFGERCEVTETRIDIQFDENLIETISSLFIHFITAFRDRNYERKSTFRKIAYDQKIITHYVEQPFNILITELSNQTYYLTVVRETFIRSERINTHVRSNQRCPSIYELVNTTLQNYNQTYRVRYYPLICRQVTELMCFYDEIYMCLCDLDRFSNCFEFNRSMSYNCRDQNDCQNGGQCFENNATCPTVIMCVCQGCYYGTKCQFSSQTYFLSLDPILGYQIKPYVPIGRQPFIVKASIAIVTLMMAFELLNGFLSILTFHIKTTREVGCGWYLLASSIASLCTIILLLIKLCYLVLSQKMDITNRSFLHFNCIVIDASLKNLLETSEWLNACVAIERIFTVLKGPNFNKIKSRRIAKWIICLLPLLTCLTNIHDPIHRQLIDDFDADEKRTWCFIQYSSSFDIYNSIINFFHFLVPLAINLISAILIIVLVSRSRSKAQAGTPLKQHFREQLREHKQLILAPCVHVLLSVPRLIIPFIKGCMKVTQDPWLFLIGYLIPFISVMLTFFTHVLPSKKFTKEFSMAFRKTMERLRFTSRS